MKNGNEARDLLGNSRQRSCTRPRIAIENPDLTKNQSDSRIRYRALWEKTNPLQAYHLRKLCTLWLLSQNRVYEVRINPFRDFICRSRSSRFYVLSCNDSECAQNWTIFRDEFENCKIRDPFIPLCSKLKAKFMRKYQLVKPIVL